MAKYIMLPEKKNGGSAEINFHSEKNEEPPKKTVEKMGDYGLKEIYLNSLKQSEDPKNRESAYLD